MKNPDFLKLRPGEGKAKIVEFEGNYCITGCFVTGGYREFKLKDGYRNDIAALTFIPIGAARVARTEGEPALSGAEALQPDSGHPDAVDYATFFIGKELYALPARDVAALSGLTQTDVPDKLDLQVRTCQRQTITIERQQHVRQYGQRLPPLHDPRNKVQGL